MGISMVCADAGTANIAPASRSAGDAASIGLMSIPFEFHLAKQPPDLI